MSTRFVVVMAKGKRKRPKVAAAGKPMCKSISKRQKVCVIVPKKRAARRSR